MKKIDLNRGELEAGHLYIGTAREISRLYRNFNRREIATPAFCEPPKFNMGKYYGLAVWECDLDGRYLSIPEMNVVAGDTALAMIFDL